MRFFVAVSLYVAVVGLTAWSADRNNAPMADDTLTISITASDNGE